MARCKWDKRCSTQAGGTPGVATASAVIVSVSLVLLPVAAVARVTVVPLTAAIVS